MRDVAGGLIYTKRAFELKKYALDYEGKVDIPDNFQERYRPITFEQIDKGEIPSLLN